MTAAVRRPKSVGPYCVGGATTSPRVHTHCRGNGPMWLPGSPPGGAPVLPAEECGCRCHTPTTALEPR